MRNEKKRLRSQYFNFIKVVKYYRIYLNQLFNTSFVFFPFTICTSLFLVRFNSSVVINFVIVYGGKKIKYREEL